METPKCAWCGTKEHLDIASIFPPERHFCSHDCLHKWEWFNRNGQNWLNVKENEMAKRKSKEQEVFNGNVTLKMLALWAMASLPNAYELRMEIATLQFYYKSGVNDGLRVEGTVALAVTEQIANDYFSKG